MNIIKRDGSTEKFDVKKIKKAILSAFESTDINVTNLDKISDRIISDMSFYDYMPIEDIQEQIIEILYQYDYEEVADAYKAYKVRHDQIRKQIDTDIEYMLNYMSDEENAATASNTDPNANIVMKNVSNMENEVPKETNRLIQRAWIKRALHTMYPDESNLGKQYVEDIKNHIIYPHDEASSPAIKNYCEAVQLYPLVIHGTSTMDGTSVNAPKHLSSFAGQICNLLFLLSSQCKGACAISEFFNYFDYYCVKDFGENYVEKSDMLATAEIIKNKQTIKDIILQTFQQIVHYWNQPSSNRGSQSPFSNISYFDKNYWNALFGNFYFPDGSQPSWERVSWLQKTFIHWFNEERSKTLLTFPVNKSAA